MQIMVGRSYIDGFGNIVEIVSDNSGLADKPYLGSNGDAYSKNGRFSYEKHSQYDLVEQVANKGSFDYNQGWRDGIIAGIKASLGVE